ncbi:NUDIX domain-containing protein [Umezawaea sp. Da 62-37]|uniref:NUDIX domain-containing protein n=1 Tax=Umezawaea sp. Da 62-37 TaxID=3075927 RepID=UPI0028F6CB85|nr:NUDIX domain-containing protein [Umezawaea sp. Da 62-37]WNV92142.1 NUDIX domain-containing protein [Umezawaea sp. Da 62-37]WNV92147.1 NUDIX domain-containing protein [Umezawaea sp. Da 62-37]
MSTSPIVRRSARALLLDDQQRLVLIKRTKQGQSPYWTSPGGGIDDADATAEAALERELAEELGATAAVGGRVLLISSPTSGGVSVQEVFIARLRTLDEAARTGEEWTDGRRGGYEVVHVPIHQVDTIDLKPAVLRGFVLDNVDALVAEATDLA